MHKNKHLILFFFLFFRASLPLFAETGLQTSLAVDLLADFKLNKESKSSDGFFTREAELSLYGPIDHLFDGVLTMSAHREHGVQMFEVHEASISSSKLLKGFSFRAGQFFLGLGRLNRFHRHDWPFTEAPIVQKKYFDSEGVSDSGLEASYLMPLDFYLNITAGVTNGWTYGHAHNEGEKPKTPTHYARVSSFLDGDDVYGLALGLNYLGRESSEGEKLELLGLDATLKAEVFLLLFLEKIF